MREKNRNNKFNPLDFFNWLYNLIINIFLFLVSLVKPNKKYPSEDDVEFYDAIGASSDEGQRSLVGDQERGLKGVEIAQIEPKLAEKSENHENGSRKGVRVRSKAEEIESAERKKKNKGKEKLVENDDDVDSDDINRQVKIKGSSKRIMPIFSRAFTNINDKFDEFIRSRKAAMNKNYTMDVKKV